MKNLPRLALATLVIALGAAAREPERIFRPVAASSGGHLWWVSDTESKFELRHHALQMPTEQFQIAAAFDDQPVAVAADGDRVWVAFAAADHKMEVVSGAAQFNPASELWFIAPGGALQLCPSIAGDSLQALAALDGEAWAIVSGDTNARRLRGGTWTSVKLPDVINGCAERMLVVSAGVLNVLGRAGDDAILRFKRENDMWIGSPLEAPGFLYAVDHAARFSCVTESRLTREVLSGVEAGSLVPIAIPPLYNVVVLGLGEGFAAVEESVRRADNTLIGDSKIFVLLPGTGEFEPPVEMSVQVSRASRWFHLIVLGVLSLAAIIGAGLVRMLDAPVAADEAAPSAPLESGDGSPRHPEPTAWLPQPKWLRTSATLIDLLPCAAVIVLVLQAPIVSILVPPLLNPDIGYALDYIVMVAVTMSFSALEEIVFGCSMGKRLVGGRVVALDGQPAAWWQHAVRNLLKGLVLLSPVLAIPSLVSPRGIGIPEIISRTAVVAAGRESA